MRFDIMLRFNSHLSHYNHEKYWKMKFKMRDGKVGKLKSYIYMYRMKRMEAFNGASLGTRQNGGSYFKSEPHVPHGIKGIFISDYVRVGEKATIFQQVTIGLKDYEHGLDKVPVIGDNVIIGAGAKVLGPIKIGNSVKIGANAVVTKDVPDGATVVGNPGKILKTTSIDKKNIS